MYEKILETMLSAQTKSKHYKNEYYLDETEKETSKIKMQVKDYE